MTNRATIVSDGVSAVASGALSLVAAAVAGTVVALASGVVSPVVSAAAISLAFQTDLKPITASVSFVPLQKETETVTTADAQTFVIGGGFLDIVVAADGTVMSVAFVAADSVTAAEASVFSLHSGVSDSVTVAEAAVKAVGVPVAETISVADDAALVAQTQLPLADGASIADATSLGSQVPVSEAVTAAEVDAKSIIQPGLVDTASVVDADTPRAFAFTTVEGSTGLVNGEGTINDLVVNDDTLTGTDLPATPFSTVLQSVSQLNGGLVNLNVINL